MTMTSLGLDQTGPIQRLGSCEWLYMKDGTDWRQPDKQTKRRVGPKHNYYSYSVG